MANLLNQNPLIFTAAQTQGFRADYGSIFPGVIRIEKILWVGATAAGAVTVIDPVTGDTLFEMSVPAANEMAELNFNANPKIVSDFKVSALPSGTLLIYLR
jgi:hypothetical protein